MQHAIFVVGNVPHAVWERDLRDRNLEYLRQLDEECFEYLARVHVEAIDSADGSRAALALRAAYHHAIETLMVLLGATVQAPHCYPGWVQKAKTEAVRAVVRSLCQLEPPIESVLRIPGPTLDSLADEIFRYAGWGDENADTAARFARGWYRLAHEWLDQNNINEYNGIKHGLRLKQGGFSIAVGIQDAPGIPAPPERMRSIGGNEFGSTFFVAEKIAGAPSIRNDPHFRLRRMSLNWSVEAMVRGMQLVSLSIANIKSYALMLNGVPGSTVTFKRPEENSFYDALWMVPGVTSASMDDEVTEADIQRSNRDELRSEMNTHRQSDNASQNSDRAKT
jgi:hypothetical protein